MKRSTRPGVLEMEALLARAAPRQQFALKGAPMHYTMENLLNGLPVGEYYVAALQRWKQVLASIDPDDAQAIAKAAPSEQM